jgi:biotin synthase
VAPGFEVLDPAAILAWLREDDEDALDRLWQQADRVRAERVGDAVHLRGLVEVSNYCVRQCAYCGIAACAGPLERYRLTHDEIVACADRAAAFGFGTVVMQAGEDPGLTGPFVARAVAEIKRRTGIAVTLSLGERSVEDLRAWREAGADRYLLRFETTDENLYRRIHPSLPGTVSDRVAQLLAMRDMGYEIGTGVMVGLPGQTWETLAHDIETFRQFDMDMIGIGPYLPSPRTPLAGPLRDELLAPPDRQVPNDEITTLKAVALTRLACPDTNIPSTTALAILDPAAGRRNGLTRGANVIMPNLTPPRYRALYEIYPGKAGVHESVETLTQNVFRLIASLGRTVGRGPGGSRAALDSSHTSGVVPGTATGSTRFGPNS